MVNNAASTPVCGDGKLRRTLKTAAREHGYSLDDLTVLSVRRDPYRLDTPSMHRDGRWFANIFPAALSAQRAMGLRVDKTHLRGVHYAALSSTKPDGTRRIRTRTGTGFGRQRSPVRPPGGSATCRLTRSPTSATPRPPCASSAGRTRPNPT